MWGRRAVGRSGGGCLPAYVCLIDVYLNMGCVQSELNPMRIFLFFKSAISELKASLCAGLVFLPSRKALNLSYNYIL